MKATRLVVLVGDDQLRPGLRAGFGDAGGDRLFIGDAGDEADLALEVDDGGHDGFLYSGLVLLRRNGGKHKPGRVTEI
jgi:hypothetical protein